MRTCVTPLVVQTANLKAVSVKQIQGVDGAVHKRPLYPATIWMPSTLDGVVGQGVTMHHTEAVGLEQDGQLGDVHVLVGMDIIGRGDTAITREGEEAWFSFRHPPKGQAIRFEDEEPV